ncbi:MAG: WD40 repeat domain-containing protein [Victivallaceae bacterium]|nr:WD40 repeat domain-containing protein [Victivallaceae bacterium]
MRYTFLLTGCMFLYAVNAFSKNTIEWKNDTPEIKVKASGLFSKTRDSKLCGSKDAPTGTFAKALAVDRYRFQWRPRWNFVGMGGAILPFVLESPDESALGIVETLPQKNAPSSSIVVFINLYNLRVNNYLLMPGKNVIKFCFIPFSSNVVCLIKAPFDKYNPKPKFQFQTMDTHIDLPVSTSRVIKDAPTAFCCSKDGSKLFAAFKDSNKIRIYDTNELSKAFKTFKTIDNPIAINRSANGKRLLITGSGKIQIFNTEQQVIPEETIVFPKFFHPDKVVLSSNDASTFLVSSHGGATYFYNGESFIKICKRSDADVNWSIAEQRIYLGLPKESTVAIYNAGNLENQEARFRFQKLRPSTSGKLYKIISLPTSGAGVAILDKLGTLSHFKRKRRRWMKEIIINQPRPQ